MIDHECSFPEVLIEAADEDDNLRAGMKVLAPCECGETPLDHLSILELHLQEMQDALLAHEPDRPLYHWSPAARRKQIIRYGLRPGMSVTTAMGGMAICLADSPSWAWALSGGMKWTPGGEWDLWQTWLGRLQDPVVLASDKRPSGIDEVRTAHRVFKRDLWLAGHRSC